VIMTGMGADGFRARERFATPEAKSSFKTRPLPWYGACRRSLCAGQADAVYPLTELAAEITRRVLHNRGMHAAAAAAAPGLRSWRPPQDDDCSPNRNLAYQAERIDPIFRQIRDLVYKTSGIYQQEEKLYLLAESSGRRIKKLGLRNTCEYWELLNAQATRVTKCVNSSTKSPSAKPASFAASPSSTPCANHSSRNRLRKK